MAIVFEFCFRQFYTIILMRRDLNAGNVLFAPINKKQGRVKFEL